MRGITVSSLLVSLALAVVPLQAEPPKADPARAQIERLGKEFIDAFARGDFPAIARMYAEDAIAFPPDGDMVKGRAAIEALWKGASDTGVKSLEFNVVDVVSSGNLAAETGTAVLHVQPAGQAETTANVKYVVVWRKGPGGWQLYRDIWNAMPGAPAVTTKPAMEMTPGMAMPPPKATPATAPKAMTTEMAMPPPKTTPATPH
jgi:uncharacterized protein (TIGR02246 family)